VRHGETEENKKGIIQGQMEGKLTIEGIQQIQQLALRLKNENIDVIYSSDLARAIETAKEIVKYHEDIPITYTKELRERNLGELEGKNMRFGTWNTLSKISNGESLYDLRNRAKKFLRKILKENYSNNLIVSHNGFIAMLISVIEHKKIKDLLDFKMDNAVVKMIELNSK